MSEERRRTRRANRASRGLRRMRPPNPTGLQGPIQLGKSSSSFRKPNPVATSKQSVTTGLPQQQGMGGVGGDLMGGVLAAKGIGDMYETGGEAREGLGKLGDSLQRAGDWVVDKMPSGFSGGDPYVDTSSLQMPNISLDTPTMFGNPAMMELNSSVLPTEYSKVGDSWTSLGGEFVGPNSAFGSPAISGMADPASGLLADSTGAMADGATTGLQTTGGVDKLGAAGSALGVGLNINDMVNSGLTFGNVTGALGSGILGASALGIGAANAWNPVGWGLLAASAGDSLFDWF